MAQVEQSFKNSLSLITILPLLADTMRMCVSSQVFSHFLTPWTESTSRIQIVAISAW